MPDAYREEAMEARARMLVGLFERSKDLGVRSGRSPMSGSRRRGMPPASFISCVLPSISASAQAKLAAIPIYRELQLLAHYLVS